MERNYRFQRRLPEVESKRYFCKHHLIPAFENLGMSARIDYIESRICTQGFPDLHILIPGKTVYIEFKSETFNRPYKVALSQIVFWRKLIFLEGLGYVVGFSNTRTRYEVFNGDKIFFLDRRPEPDSIIEKGDLIATINFVKTWTQNVLRTPKLSAQEHERRTLFSRDQETDI